MRARAGEPPAKPESEVAVAAGHNSNTARERKEFQRGQMSRRSCGRVSGTRNGRRPPSRHFS
jgi:hypothetical protein